MVVALVLKWVDTRLGSERIWFKRPRKSCFQQSKNGGGTPIAGGRVNCFSCCDTSFAYHAYYDHKR